MTLSADRFRVPVLGAALATLLGAASPATAESITAPLFTYDCPASCSAPQEVVYVAGEQDDFAPPDDPTAPHPDILAAYPTTPFKDFDSTTSNRVITHTFSNLPSRILGAELEVRMKPHSDIADNDALHLVQLGGQSFAYGARIRQLPAAGGTWDNGDPAATFVFDLDDLFDTPEGADPPGNSVLAEMAARGRLDLLVQDDTAIDYAILRVEYCPDYLLLNGDRFRVDVEWEDFQGNTGVGHGVELTSDTGYFWFFRDTNVELVIKVLDGRPVNGHWWVFYGALSNVEYTVTVTDTLTNRVMTYINPSGNLASEADTAAFPAVE